MYNNFNLRLKRSQVIHPQRISVSYTVRRSNPLKTWSGVTKGYVGRRLAFIIIWMFVTMFPIKGPAVAPTVSPLVIGMAGIITLMIVIIPPIIAARQIYRAFD
jgi:hypothetical protein